MARAVIGFGPAPQKPNWNDPHYVCVDCKYDHNVCQLKVVCESVREITEADEFGSPNLH